METTEKIWMDGKMVDWDKAKTHVLTHTLHYGAGVFEGIRFYKTDKGPAVFRLKEHIKRFFKSASDINMEPTFTQEDIIKAIINTIKINKLESGYVRPIMYYGYGKMGLTPEGAPTNIAIAVWPWTPYLGDAAIKVKISKYIRIHPDSTKADSKICGHYVNSMFAHLEAKKAGYDEALLLDYKGNIAEGPVENIFTVENNALITPKPGNILLGITRDSIIKVASDLGIEVKEEDISPERLNKADEAFLTGTAIEVTPISKVNEQLIGDGKPGKITNMLKKKYLDIVHGKDEKYLDWLSFVENKLSK